MDLMAKSRRETVYVSLQHLDPSHYHILVHAIHNVLFTELAELTLAELADGLPLWSTNRDTRGGMLLRGSHPLASHKTLCDRALEHAKEFRDAFDPSILSFDANVIQTYQDAQPRTHPFNMRLVELVALSIHQIGVVLFKHEPKIHDGEIDSVVSFKEESKWVNEDGRKYFEEELYEPRPTLFFHVDFMEHEYYPDGIADIVGYWTEDRILGGVARFDRGASGLESKDVYFQSGRLDSTFRTWRLLPSQFAAIVEFFLAEQPVCISPLPILVTDENMHRYDPWYAIPNHVYRDAWELDLPPIPIPDPRYERDVRSTGDYPELNAVFERLDADARGLPYYDPEGNRMPPPSAPSSPQLEQADDWCEYWLRVPEAEVHAKMRSEVLHNEASAYSGDEDDSDVDSVLEFVRRNATSPDAMYAGKYVFPERHRQREEHATDGRHNPDQDTGLRRNVRSDKRTPTPQRKSAAPTLGAVESKEVPKDEEHAGDIQEQAQSESISANTEPSDPGSMHGKGKAGEGS